jgi:hypothetical protein
MQHHKGTTLLEVLVSIFIMGIGMLALLTLFPLGALSMAQAIRDDRINHSAENARAVAEALDVRHVSLLNPVTGAYNTGAFNNPGGGLRNLLNNANVPAVAGIYDGPSYPVLVDPFGTLSPSAPATIWVTGGINYLPNPQPWYGVPRRGLTPTFPPAYPQPPGLPAGVASSVFRYFTLNDEILFNQDGGADLTTTGQINRESDYSWAYLLRRPRVLVTSVVEMSIVVYHRRPLSLTPVFNPNEVAYAAVYDNSAGTVTLTWGAGNVVPVIRPNSWILDGTLLPDPNNPNNPPRPHGFFYRVTGVTSTGPNTLELQVSGNNPFREFPQATATNGVAIVMPEVAEVFDVGTQWLP